MTTSPRDDDLAGLRALARQLGASDAAVIDAAAIPVQDDLAAFCRDCPDHGGSMSCPPNVGGPAAFRELQAGYRRALIVKLEVPAEVLLTDERLDVYRLLHEVVSGVEREAARRGFSGARSFAGAPCRKLFCADERDCAVLAGGECRHADAARQSMSGFGINVGQMVALAGWSMGRITSSGVGEGVKLGLAVGLVLLD